MTFVLVQSSHNKGNSPASINAGTVGVGNLLVFAMNFGSGSGDTIPSGGGTWAQIGGGPQRDAPNSQSMTFWYCENATGGATTVNLTNSGIAASSWSMSEFSGVATSTSLLASDITKAFATSTTTADGNTSNTINPAGFPSQQATFTSNVATDNYTVQIAAFQGTASNECLVVGVYQGDAGVAPTITHGTGFSDGPNEPGTGGATGTTVVEWKQVTVAAADVALVGQYVTHRGGRGAGW